MKKFIILFKKVDGINILKQYAKAHVLIFAIFQTILNGFSAKSLEIVRLSVNNKIQKKLRKRNLDFIKKYKSEHCMDNLERIKTNKIWVCWLQGLENAPILVQKCYDSLQKNLLNKEIILITENNYRDYINFPDFIQRKVDDNIITKTHFSDLLRLELLAKYGGTWIDATVFCSGSNYPSYIFDSDLFVYQNLKPGLDGHSTRISSWFMTSCTNHPIILLTRELIYEYWRYNNILIDYFLIHDFFELAIETYPQEWQRVIPFPNSIPHILLLRLFDDYDENIWNATKQLTDFHKLSYKFSVEQFYKKGTYFNEIL
ncbi:capsular polysaccharide synthesis protein [Candidatus Stoquefichus massiliensis]|uniref:capsular polysaccharide synthesis protein n=1 Tax=Candidatus Stoquefichus massiliensis TaxID=1470350 RepID=UPI000487D709|nr:capsular polysaccharide synthesis protein [Candidatus Stoquefichus massiliensis]